MPARGYPINLPSKIKNIGTTSTLIVLPQITLKIPSGQFIYLTQFEVDEISKSVFLKYTRAGLLEVSELSVDDLRIITNKQSRLLNIQGVKLNKDESLVVRSYELSDTITARLMAYQGTKITFIHHHKDDLLAPYYVSRFASNLSKFSPQTVNKFDIIFG